MKRGTLVAGIVAALLCVFTVSGVLADLKDIKQRNVIRHLGVPYANFVTGDGDGLDAEIIKLYAHEIGVRYEYVRASWASVIADLAGLQVVPKGEDVEVVGKCEVKGDIIGNGLTVLPWRSKVISYSHPYFPSAIWVLARDDSDVRPIVPAGDIKKDIEATRKLLKGREVLGIRNTCVDHSLYHLEGIKPLYKEGLTLNDLAPAMIKGDAPLTILDVPDAMIALQKYPGKIKVLGTITDRQVMAFGISKSSPELLKSFNSFLEKIRENGKLRQLVLKYYPHIGVYFADFTRP